MKRLSFHSECGAFEGEVKGISLSKGNMQIQVLGGSPAFNRLFCKSDNIVFVLLEYSLIKGVCIKPYVFIIYSLSL